MSAIILFAFAILYIIACIEDIRRQSHDAAVKRQWDKREKERDAFMEMYGASDDEVAAALEEDALRTPLAETIRERLKKEANVDHTANMNCFIRSCNLIPLGILAQSGKVPSDFIRGEIRWDRYCLEIKPGGTFCSPEARAMIERFLRWYDDELVSHGFPERLMQRNPDVSESVYLTGDDYRTKATEIRNLDKLRVWTKVFWPSSRDGISCDLKCICSRLIKPV